MADCHRQTIFTLHCLAWGPPWWVLLIRPISSWVCSGLVCPITWKKDACLSPISMNHRSGTRCGLPRGLGHGLWIGAHHDGHCGSRQICGDYRIDVSWTGAERYCYVNLSALWILTRILHYCIPFIGNINGSSRQENCSLIFWCATFAPPTGSRRLSTYPWSNNTNTDPTQKIMLQKRYQTSAPYCSKTPGALADSMSKTVAGIFSDIAKDIHSRLSTATTLV